MQVEWKESCWPRLLGAAMRLLRLPAADRGMLVIRLVQKKALGRLIVGDGTGKPQAYLIDAINSRDKAFPLPSRLGTEGFLLMDDRGEILFSYGIKAAPDLQEQPEAEQTQEAGICEGQPEVMGGAGEAAPEIETEIKPEMKEELEA